MERPLLEIDELSVAYGPVLALQKVSMVVPEGSIIAILGPNGAGKTTLMRTISGLVTPASGRILYRGESLAHKKVHEIAKAGIVQSPEGRHVFRDLTVDENLRVGAYTVSAPTTQKNLARVYKYFPELEGRRKQIASTLSGGEQQMLAIGRALMASPKVLLLDEPSLGLAPMIIQNIFRIIQEIRKEGTTILIVEQNAMQTLKIADYAYVLSLGKVHMEGKASDLLQNEQLITAYLGGSK